MAKEKLYRINVPGNDTTQMEKDMLLQGGGFVMDDVEEKDSEIKNIVLPIVYEKLKEIIQAAADRGVEIAKKEIIPEVEKRGRQFYRFLKRNIKERYERRKLRKLNIVNEEDKVIPFDENKELHTQEELNQIMTNMKYAAYYIATRIDELSNLAASDKGDAEKKSEMESKIKELDTDDIKGIIDFMLEGKNKYLLDKETLRKFKAFKHDELIVNGELVPIKRYIEVDALK